MRKITTTTGEFITLLKGDIRSGSVVKVALATNVVKADEDTGDKMLIPINRYLLIEHIKEEGNTKSTILLPEEVARRPDFSLVKLLAVAQDCEKFNGEVGQTLIANTNMIEEIKICDRVFNIIMESHIVGLVSGE